MENYSIPSSLHRPIPPNRFLVEVGSEEDEEEYLTSSDGEMENQRGNVESAETQSEEDEQDFRPHINPFEVLGEEELTADSIKPKEKLQEVSSSTTDKDKIERRASEQAAKVWNNWRQSKEKKKKKTEKPREEISPRAFDLMDNKGYRSTSQPKQSKEETEQPRRKVHPTNKPSYKPRSKLLTPPVEDPDEALARQLQQEWDSQDFGPANTQQDEMLAMTLQVEDFQRREKVHKERIRAQRERMVRLQNSLSRRRPLDPRFIDVDNMSYEELLALEERIGVAKSPGASKEEIGLLPVTIIEEEIAAVDSIRCSICLNDLEMGDTLKTLPCFHKYHSDCVDQWLVHKKTCPVCQKPITD